MVAHGTHAPAIASVFITAMGAWDVYGRTPIYIYIVSCYYGFLMADMHHFVGRDILAIEEFSKEELLTVLRVAGRFLRDSSGHEGQGAGRFARLLDGKLLASLFFEPSTRTRLSFEAAMKRLGGGVIGFSDWRDTSVMKGEDLMDTIRVLDGYCDVIVIRHPKEGSAATAAAVASHPVINGGDGSNQHPTQTFLDLFTMQQEMGRLDGLNIGFLGDLKYGRTVHSLATALRNFNVKMFFISPDSLRMPAGQLQTLRETHSCVEAADISVVAPELDIIYATRIQRERFQFEADFTRVKGSYKLDTDILAVCKPSVRIMHPLPRVGEIKHELDASAQAIYFKQAHYGVPVRQALLSLVVGIPSEPAAALLAE